MFVTQMGWDGMAWDHTPQIDTTTSASLVLIMLVLLLFALENQTGISSDMEYFILWINIVGNEDSSLPHSRNQLIE